MQVNIISSKTFIEQLFFAKLRLIFMIICKWFFKKNDHMGGGAL